MNRYLFSPLPVLLGAVSFTLAAQAGVQSGGGKTGTTTSTQALPQGAATASTSAPALGSAPSRSASGGAAGTPAAQGTASPASSDANRGVVLSPTASNQQFRAQRAAELNGATGTSAVGPGDAVVVSGVGTMAPGSVLAGQLVSLVPGRSVTLRDVSGLVRTFPLAPRYALPSDVATGSSVILTTTAGGYVMVANATGQFPASGGIGEATTNVTQIVSANDNVYRPNLTTQAMPQGSITSMGGFAQPFGAQVGTGGTISSPAGTFETTPAPGYANDTFASASTLANDTIPGAVATGGAGSGAMGAGTFASSGNSGSYNPTPLATIARGMAGTSAARLPNTALRSGALASIEGTGRHLVTRTALTTWRVNSWDGSNLVVTDDRGHRRTFAIVRGISVPRNLQAGKLVVLDMRGDMLRAVRYLL